MAELTLRPAQAHELPSVLAFWHTAAENSHRGPDSLAALAALHLRDPYALIVALSTPTPTAITAATANATEAAATDAAIPIASPALDAITAIAVAPVAIAAPAVTGLAAATDPDATPIAAPGLDETPAAAIAATALDAASPAATALDAASPAATALDAASPAATALDAATTGPAGGELVGTVIAGWDGWRCHLYRLAVHPSHRRAGIGRALIAAAEERFQVLGGGRVDAMVLDDNEQARRIWQAAGYQLQPEWSRWIKPLRPGG